MLALEQETRAKKKKTKGSPPPKNEKGTLFSFVAYQGNKNERSTPRKVQKSNGLLHVYFDCQMFSKMACANHSRRQCKKRTSIGTSIETRIAWAKNAGNGRLSVVAEKNVGAFFYNMDNNDDNMER